MNVEGIDQKIIEVLVEGVPIGNLIMDYKGEKIDMVEIYDDWLHTKSDLDMLEAFVQKAKEYEWSDEE